MAKRVGTPMNEYPCRSVLYDRMRLQRLERNCAGPTKAFFVLFALPCSLDSRAHPRSLQWKVGMRLGRACPPKLCRRRRAAVHGVHSQTAGMDTYMETCRCRTGVVCVHDRTGKVAKSPDRVSRCQQPAEASFFSLPRREPGRNRTMEYCRFRRGSRRAFPGVHHAPRQSAHLLGHGGKALADWPHLSQLVVIGPPDQSGRARLWEEAIGAWLVK
ncbi:hypothetical protein J3F84DRAFT_240958 [Trichoderma pleuroticola]